MPHVNDRARLKQYLALMSVPQHVLQAATVNGRIELDTKDAGQENFQALLWDLLFSSGHSHPWDHRGGRSFRELAGYYEWIMPAPHKLTIQASVAPRVAQNRLREESGEPHVLANLGYHGCGGECFPSLGPHSLYAVAQSADGAREHLVEALAPHRRDRARAPEQHQPMPDLAKGAILGGGGGASGQQRHPDRLRRPGLRP
ncbi:hypothetical protein ABZW10_17910 [Kitasatospora sp. NPDC004723]|uniref:hypothetical protein n=1 Tax=Kitasatospora sp. NPDC004723 TaxID=3154288 RepID=UPI0033B12CAB